MGNIQDLLAQILSARYGRDVRQSIHDAIRQCYDDGHAGAIDLQARTLLGDTDISGISETVTGAVVELGESVGTAQTTADGAVTAAGDAMTAAQAAQSTADEKLNTSDAWKCAQLSKTFNNITIATGGTYDFVFDVPDGATNASVIYARSADSDRPLLPINIFRYGAEFHNHMYNAGPSISNATIIIQITYMYK